MQNLWAPRTQNSQDEGGTNKANRAAVLKSAPAGVKGDPGRGRLSPPTQEATDPKEEKDRA